MSTFYTVEIPHTRPAQVSEWPSKRDAVENFRPSVPKRLTLADLMTHEEVFEAAGDDLSSFHTFESLKELDEWSRKYASDSRPGGCGGHQSATIRAQVEEILEDSLAEDAPEISTVQDAIDAIEAFTVGSVNGWGSDEFSFEQQLQDQRRHFARYKAAQVFLHSLEGKHASTPPRKHSTPEDRLTMIHDPGHGWLVVPIADVEASGIEVSAHSYRDKANFYLEQDKDAVAYLVACGYKFGPKHRDHIDIEHRHYKSIGFDTGAVRCVEEN